MSNIDKFIWWIEERYNVYKYKEVGKSKPWSDDPTFQQTYFCNVHRENDRVTQWIRQNYHKDLILPELNMIIARLINKPTSLEAMEWPFVQWTNLERIKFSTVMQEPGTWGSAYIVSTNGRPVPKHEHVLDVIDGAYAATEQISKGVTCLAVHKALQGVYGLASFMAAQVVADLKNTEGHRLYDADDWWTFCAHGPGSLRGMAWVYEYNKIPPQLFYNRIPKLRYYVDDNLVDWVPKFCNQDLQNCLCEFDKYMRVSTGAGRSKRKYNGN